MFHFVVTEGGLFTLSHLGQVGLWPLQAVHLISGDFRGLEVMEPYSEDPVILTTQKKDVFTVQANVVFIHTFQDWCLITCFVLNLHRGCTRKMQLGFCSIGPAYP